MSARLVSALWAITILAAAIAAGADLRAPAPAPDLLLVSLDTVRADHLSAYGYFRDTSPALAALAREGAVFRNAFSCETNTTPSHASMLTGLYPHHHGSRYNTRPIRPDVPTLAEILRRAGYRTGAFVSALPMRRRGTGLGRGFEIYDDAFRFKRRSRTTVDRAIAWLQQPGSGRPRFAFVHLYDAHGPYEPDREYAALYRSGESGPTLARLPDYQRLHPTGSPIHQLAFHTGLYDAAIRGQDDQLARLLKSVDRARTLVVVIADHGETLGERWWPLDHGAEVYDEQLRVPWIVVGPRIAPRSVASTVATVDLTPTLLDLLAIPSPAGARFDGRSLADLLDGTGRDSASAVFASARTESERYADRGYKLDLERFLLAIREARWKLILFPGIERDLFELYDLDADPGEKRDLARKFPDQVARLLDRLRAWQNPAIRVPRTLPDDPEARAALRALGYIQ